MRDAVVDSRVASRALGEACDVGPPAVFRPYGLGSYARVAPAQLFRAFVFVAMQALLPPPHFGHWHGSMSANTHRDNLVFMKSISIEKFKFRDVTAHLMSEDLLGQMLAMRCRLLAGDAC